MVEILIESFFLEWTSDFELLAFLPVVKQMEKRQNFIDWCNRLCWCFFTQGIINYNKGIHKYVKNILS